MHLKIPPALVTIFFGLLMWTLDSYLLSYFSLDLNVFPARLYIIFLIASGIVGLLGLYQFYRHSTTVDPHRPEKAQALVTGGIYRISRNPMYLSLLLLLVAFACSLQNLSTLLLIPFFIWYMNRFQIKPEEEVLMNKFGEEYRRYTMQVRRWL